MLHANQMRLRSTQLTDDDFTAFADAFNLPVRPPQVAKGDERTENHNQQTSSQGTPALDVKPEQSSNALSESRRSKRGHIPKKQYKLDLRRETHKYP
jgi:hypothetical protein